MAGLAGELDCRRAALLGQQLLAGIERPRVSATGRGLHERPGRRGEPAKHIGLDAGRNHGPHPRGDPEPDPAASAGPDREPAQRLRACIHRQHDVAARRLSGLQPARAFHARGQFLSVHQPGGPLARTCNQGLGDGASLPGATCAVLSRPTLLCLLCIVLQTGPIPNELGQLAALVSLSLSNNFMYGSLPASLADLTNLTELDLTTNGLSGIPGLLASVGVEQLAWREQMLLCIWDGVRS